MIILFPKIIVLLLGGFFIFLGLNILFFGFYFGKKTKTNKESYVEVGGYKIYR
jgi:hypothetical protein